MIRNRISQLYRLRTEWPRLFCTVAGPLGIAAGNFILSIALLTNISVVDFGAFSFIMVISQLGVTLVNSTSATPMSVILVSTNRQNLVNIRGSCLFAGLVCCLIIGTISLFSIFYLKNDPRIAFLSSAFCIAAATRWIIRSFNLVLARYKIISISDIAYIFGSLGLSTVILLLGIRLPLLFVLEILVCVSLASAIILLNRDILTAIFQSTDPILTYKAIWRSQVRWSLRGVVATEITANSHSYIVTLANGPQAFASIAVAGLFWKPVQTILPAITAVERPAIAQALSRGDINGAQRITLRFRKILNVTLTFNSFIAAIIIAVLYIQPSLLNYTFIDVFAGVIIWGLITFVRSIRSPDSAYIQAHGKFEGIAKASLYSSPVSLLSVTILVLAGFTQGALIGILAGEIFMAFLISRELNNLIKSGRIVN